MRNKLLDAAQHTSGEGKIICGPLLEAFPRYRWCIPSVNRIPIDEFVDVNHGRYAPRIYKAHKKSCYAGWAFIDGHNPHVSELGSYS